MVLGPACGLRMRYSQVLRPVLLNIEMSVRLEPFINGWLGGVSERILLSAIVESRMTVWETVKRRNCEAGGWDAIVLLYNS